ncbi:hypothetical protein ANTRET_LOCUS6133 [Anthophora retusa]
MRKEACGNSDWVDETLLHRDLSNDESLGTAIDPRAFHFVTSVHRIRGKSRVERTVVPLEIATTAFPMTLPRQLSHRSPGLFINQLDQHLWSGPLSLSNT